MPTLFTFLLHWFQSQPPLAQIGIIIAITQAIATFIVGLLPQKWGSNPLVKALGHYGYAKFNDAFGTWKWPFVSARDPQPDAKPTPRIPPLGMILFALSLTSCTGANGRPITAAEVGREIRVISHDASKAVCAARPMLAAISIAAEGALPALSMEPAAADMFCATVAAVERSLVADAFRVLPAGQTAMVAPTYSVGASGFSVRASR